MVFASLLVYALLSSAVSAKYAVTIGHTTYQSDLSLTDDVTSFLGLPYAAPPVGLLRWRAPVIPTTPTGVVNATAQPDQCPQAGFGLSMTNPYANISLSKRDVSTSEDCLYLNVHMPSTATQKSKLPVVIWVHGGGYDSGSTSLYPAQDLVSESGNQIIAVGIQFRHGIYGYLAGSAVKDGGVLNTGLLDQQFAFKWVQDHISQFGGDPTKVTVWGSSSGAGAVLQHIVANNGVTKPPLFRAAIMSSPFLPFQYRFDDPLLENVYQQVVADTGCSQSNNTLACLRDVDEEILTSASANISAEAFLGSFTFDPVVDDTFIVDRPTEILRRGKTNGDMLLVVTNSHEGDIFLTGLGNMSLAQYQHNLFSRLDTSQLKRAVGLYSTIPGTVFAQEAASYGENILICPAYYALASFASAKKKAYKAEFAIPPGTHGLDLSYIFRTYFVPPTFTDPTFFDTFSQSFLSTVISHDPNAKLPHSKSKLPTWDTWSPSTKEMLFNKTTGSAMDIRSIETDQRLIERCDFWLQVASVNSQ